MVTAGASHAPAGEARDAVQPAHSGRARCRVRSCSRSSLRLNSRRARTLGSSAAAARTAHPGSCSCLQLRKRQSAATPVRSPNTSSMPAAASQRPSSRVPGVSTINPPPGKLDQFAVRGGVPALAVGTHFAGRERLVAGQAGSRASTCRCHSVRRAPRPGPRAVFRGGGASPAPDALTAMTSVPAATDRAERRSSSMSALRSDLVSKTTGAAPLDQAMARARSMRRSRSGAPSATVMKTRSMLAATA